MSNNYMKSSVQRNSSLSPTRDSVRQSNDKDNTVDSVTEKYINERLSALRSTDSRNADSIRKYGSPSRISAQSPVMRSSSADRPTAPTSCKYVCGTGIDGSGAYVSSKTSGSASSAGSTSIREKFKLYNDAYKARTEGSASASASVSASANSVNGSRIATSVNGSGPTKKVGTDKLKEYTAAYHARIEKERASQANLRRGSINGAGITQLTQPDIASRNAAHIKARISEYTAQYNASRNSSPSRMSPSRSIDGAGFGDTYDMPLQEKYLRREEEHHGSPGKLARDMGAYSNEYSKVVTYKPVGSATEQSRRNNETADQRMYRLYNNDAIAADRGRKAAVIKHQETSDRIARMSLADQLAHKLKVANNEYNESRDLVVAIQYEIGHIENWYRHLSTDKQSEKENIDILQDIRLQHRNINRVHSENAAKIADLEIQMRETNPDKYLSYKSTLPSTRSKSPIAANSSANANFTADSDYQAASRRSPSPDEQLRSNDQLERVVINGRTEYIRKSPLRGSSPVRASTFMGDSINGSGICDSRACARRECDASVVLGNEMLNAQRMSESTLAAEMMLEFDNDTNNLSSIERQAIIARYIARKRNESVSSSPNLPVDMLRTRELSLSPNRRLFRDASRSPVRRSEHEVSHAQGIHGSGMISDAMDRVKTSLGKNSEYDESKSPLKNYNPYDINSRTILADHGIKLKHAAYVKTAISMLNGTTALLAVQLKALRAQASTLVPELSNLKASSATGKLFWEMFDANVTNAYWKQCTAKFNTDAKKIVEDYVNYILTGLVRMSGADISKYVVDTSLENSIIATAVDNKLKSFSTEFKHVTFDLKAIVTQSKLALSTRMIGDTADARVSAPAQPTVAGSGVINYRTKSPVRDLSGRRYIGN